jgi:transglutaminase-like putative cysteine protease
MHRRSLFFACLFVSASFCQEAPKAPAPKERKVEITYESTIADIPAGSKLLKVWVPMPRSEQGVQEVISATLEPIPNAKIVEKTDKSGENKYWYVELPNPPASVTVKATIQANRHEILNNKFAGAGTKKLLPEEREKLKDALAANEKVPTSGAIEKIADQVVSSSESNSVTAARKIYDHVLNTMEYKKTGTGWGRGDTMWACENKYGNCTDFHSVFMSIGRLRGIPVRFSMGLPVPPERGAGAIGGYHCWAEFYVPELGWVPVDISEADKNPKMAEYYFGGLTEDRVGFTRGRDLELDPPPASGKQNFFIYPIVEVDGKAIPEKHAFKYKDVP